MPSSGTKSVSHGIQNLKDIIDLSGYTKSSSYILPLGYAAGGSYTGYSLSLYADSTKIYVDVYIDRSGYTSSYINIKYTKTTD